VAVRDRFPGRRIVAVFEPRSFTAQLRRFQEAYAEALRHADRVWLAGLYRPERYDEITGLDPTALAEDLSRHGVASRHLDSVDELVQGLVVDGSAGDVIVIMSNGGFGGIHKKLLGALQPSG
jgi:UDP-N-acetylmuramate: L-alanyl-gamma-D-glutamyl-meso-diaminopimelate ligase